MMMVSRVKTYEEALAVALIRNECRQWMTNNNCLIGVGEQLAFFKKIRSGRCRMFLFIVREDGEPIGYGVLKINRNRACLTGGLAEVFRGKGLGKKLFRTLRDMAVLLNKKPWLTVLRSNMKAVRLYTHLGFHITKATKRLYTMEYRP